MTAIGCAAAGPETLHVDLGARTGPVHGGATGMLYGLSDPGVPAAALISGARPATVAQKAPAGRQHPNGDALQTAPSFFDAGGGAVLIYMQDVYSQWPYEEPGMDDFLAKVTVMVSAAAETALAARLQWVPFNEPDWIWYADWEKDRERFLDDWAKVYREIRRTLPDAVIVGPNEMNYNHDRLRDFLSWAKEHDVLPQVVSWHELKPPSLQSYPEHHADYRKLEASLDLPQLPININEYGSRRDLSNPGRMVQWISMFEVTKVDADMAYWTYAGNLDDHAVQTQQANGGWWLLKWYADLTGETVRCEPLSPSVPGLRGTAAVDVARRQATVLLGGTARAVEVDLTSVSAAVFGEVVDVTVSRTSWSGYEGDAPAPCVVSRSRTTLTNGELQVMIEGGDPTAAYQLLVTPAEVEPAVETIWRARYEARDAELTGALLVPESDDADEYFISGGCYVAAFAGPASSVAFSVEVPRSDIYTASVFYGTAGVPARQVLTVDDRQRGILDYPATLNEAYRGRLDVQLELAGGRHRVALSGLAASPAAVSINRLDLAGPGGVETSRYPARTARLAGTARLTSGSSVRPATVSLADGGSAAFYVAASEDGYYDLAVIAEATAATALNVTVSGRPVQDVALERAGLWEAAVRVHLGQGISEVTVRSPGLAITVVQLTRAATADTATIVVTAEEFRLFGGARLVRDGLAHSGYYADGLGNGASLVVQRRTLPGAVNLAVRYANAAKNQASHYNTDVISRTATIAEAGGASVTAWFRHTYAWNNFWSLVVPFELRTQDGDITIGNPDGPAPNIDRLSFSPLVLSATVGLIERQPAAKAAVD